MNCVSKPFLIHGTLFCLLCIVQFKYWSPADVIKLLLARLNISTYAIITNSLALSLLFKSKECHNKPHLKFDTTNN
jgi:hypothetical protein